MSNIKDETIALAALFQACSLIQKVARYGSFDANDASSIIRGIIITNPKVIEDIYDPKNLNTGFRQLLACIGGSNDKTESVLEISKTAFRLIALEQALEKNTAIFDTLGNKIDMLRVDILNKCQDYETQEPSNIIDMQYISMYAKIYQEIISPNFPRLIIFGEEAYLRQVENQEKIRALLLSAIRSIVLWRQVGGRRLMFLFRRKAIIEMAKKFAIDRFN